ncbi:MAG TPA: DHA2 family efflux MFS transporter permease subunit [Candidatus Acidoferrum sp.]|nr:DHA2 family efflux MFS transporter permease subunit [Candidatus Acidoferrum sp.]
MPEITNPAGKDHRSVNPWVVTFSVMLATFMEILDTTVVNVSIPHIAGNLSATVEEGTWVVTSYLVSNAVILPMSGWLANYMGRKRLLLTCVAGFTITSLCCGFATSLQMLIFFRVLQGLTGGGLQPLAQAILLETFPRERHGQAMAAFGIGILLAPILGPTLGGWITDNYTWRWIFYLNLPVGVLSLLMMNRFVFDPPYIRRAAGRVDLWGIGFLALGVGTLQVVLDTGQRKDWFSSHYIRFFATLCVAGLVLFVIRELTTSHPVVDLRALRERAFSTGVFLISLLGFLLYASLVLLPIYLQTLLGYPAYQAGLALSPRGIGSLATTPLAGYLTSKTDPRRLLVIGLVLGSVTMFDFSHLNLNAGYQDILWPQVVQGMALSFLFIPLMACSMSRISKENMGNATSIFNLMRNIGGSLGIAIMTTFLVRRTQMHQSHLAEKISTGNVQTRQMLQQMQVWFHVQGADTYTASRRALAAIYGVVQQHASMLAFVEAFWIMGIMFLVMVPFVFGLRNPRAKPRIPAPAPEIEAVELPVEQHVEEEPVLVH